MKKNYIGRIGLLVGLILGLALLPANQLKVQARDIIATVEGTVQSGTTSELLLLSTKEGRMEIKVDSETDLSACKVLLTDKKISVSVYRGSDAYLHAAQITSGAITPAVTMDNTKTMTATGTISGKSTENLLYFNTAPGEMQIKLDSTTNISGCSLLTMGRNYTIACARGSDGYMHAVTITDAASSPALPNAPAGGNSVTGTVVDKTKEDLLYLSTNQGEMQFKIDANADTSRGMVLTPGRKLSVSFYRGSDAYLHASWIAGEKETAAAVELDTATMAEVTGTVDGSSNENILYLNTPQGKMELKLDAIVNSNCKVLVSGKKITVTCVRGSDAYMHALNIKGA